MFSNSINDSDHYCPPPAPDAGNSSLMLLKEGRRSWKSSSSSNEIVPNCPRCASSNTKFCYYNNYSLSQPRYFCKGCRRYWTKGGSLRNVPVGGGCRKSRRSSSNKLSTRGNGLHSNNKYVTSPGTSGSSTTTTSGDSDHGANIDLAAVFAKFLNQDTSGGGDDREFLISDQEFSSDGTMDSASPPEMMMMHFDYGHHHEIDENTILFDEQLGQLSDLLGVDDHFGYYSTSGPSFYDDQIKGLNVIPHDRLKNHACNDVDDQNLREVLENDDHYHDYEQSLLTEFDSMLGRDDVEDKHNNMGWSSSSNNLPNLDMQNVVLFQDFGPFSIDEHDHAQHEFLPNIAACEEWSSFDDLSRPGY